MAILAIMVKFILSTSYKTKCINIYLYLYYTLVAFCIYVLL